MHTEEQLNQRLINDYEHYLANKDKPLSQRHRTTSMRDGYAKRYPELKDDSYIQSMKDAYSKSASNDIDEDESLLPTSSNLSVSRESLLDA